MTIRLRLALLFSVATLVLLIGGGTLFVTQLRAGLEHSLDATLAARAEGITGQMSRVGTARSSSQDRQRTLGTANGIYAQLLTPHGKLLDSSRGLADAALLTPAQAATSSTHTLILDRSVTFTSPGDSGPEPVRVLAKSVRHLGLVVAVAIPRDVVDKAVSGAQRQLVILAVIVLVLAGPGSWLLTRAALRPVERMRNEVSELQVRGAGAALAVPHTRDEISRLALTFNGLLAHLHAAASRERAFVADAGHELRTPLSVLKGELELARRPARTRPELAATIEVAAEETDRLVRLTEDMLFLTRNEDSPPQPWQRFDLSALADSAIEAASTSPAAQGRALTLAAPGPVLISGNPDHIRQAVDNLLVNAMRYSPPGAPVTISLACDKNGTRLTVTDDGPGFPAEFLPLAFERFTRADDARARAAGDATSPGGSGLGLSIVRSVMTKHGGTAHAANRPDRGAEITLHWPPDQAWSTSGANPSNAKCHDRDALD